MAMERDVIVVLRCEVISQDAIGMRQCRRCGNFVAGPPIEGWLVQENTKDGKVLCWPCWYKL